MASILVTGGSGYFGEILALRLLDQGHFVRVFDLNQPAFTHARLEWIEGDIRNADSVRRACDGIEIVHHDVAQVPLAKDKKKFWSVNYDGTKILLSAAADEDVKKVVYTSSSAVFGVPESNPVTSETCPNPAEAYGKAKFAAENLLVEAAQSGLDVSIIRPRTILGHGRLGVVQILFEWIERGDPVPVFDGGTNVYQFVHADDLAEACLSAGFRDGWGVYNVGSAEFGTMSELLHGLIAHANSLSKIVSVPMAAATKVMSLLSWMGLSPLGPYHALMYGRSLYFDLETARRDLGYRPRYSDIESICDSYDWYVSNRSHLVSDGRSPHQSILRKGAVALTPFALRTLMKFR